MEQKVIFRDYQEQTAGDHTNLQIYAQQSFDDIVHDAVTASLRYYGFNTVKSNQAEITTDAGRFYGKNSAQQVGAIFSTRTQTVISLVAYLAVSSQRFVTVVASGTENQIDNQTRDFLTNVTTGQTEPQAVPMTTSRDAVLSIISGAEAGTPQPPAVPAGSVAICNVLLDTTGVVSVTMLTAGLVHSTEELDIRLQVVEAFDAQIAPRVTALASDLADLAARLQNQFDRNLLLEITGDVASLKAKIELPAAAAHYGATYLLWDDPNYDDKTDSQSLGYHALVEYGVRFPAQNANIFALSLFNSLDPNLAYAGNGLLLPAYTEVLKLRTNPGNQGIGDQILIGQYGFQTFTYKELDIPYMRIRSGGTYFQCSNGASGWYQTPDTSVSPYWLPNFSTYQVPSGAGNNFDSKHDVATWDYLWVDSWTEPYWTLEAVNQSINGALIAQSFLVSNDMWITKMGIYLTSVASATDIKVTLCKVNPNSGIPDLSQTLSVATITGASLRTGINYANILPIFAAKGDRMAVIITSAANHGLGILTSGPYLNGTLFYSTDSTYFLGDLTKDLYIEIWGPQFKQSTTLAEFSALSLSGGIRAIDLTVKAQVPGSCNIIYEVMPDGTNTWIPISTDAPLAPFVGAPVLARFRARMIGTPDVAPGLELPNSIVKIWAPGPQFKWVTKPITIAAATTSLTLQFVVENFDTVAHTFTPKVYTGGPLTVRNPTAVTTTLLDITRKRYQITASFTVPSTSSFVAFVQGDTNSISNVFHIAKLVWWSL